MQNNLIPDLTEEEYRVIFELAHKEWIADKGQSKYKKQSSQYLLARSYFKAVTSFLAIKGYKIELNDVKK